MQGHAEKRNKIMMIKHELYKSTTKVETKLDLLTTK